MKAPRRGDNVTARSRRATPTSGGDSLDLQRNHLAVHLPAPDRAFWDAHSGISPTPRLVELGSDNNATAQLLLGSTSSLAAAEVAVRLHLSASTVRHYKTQRKLYGYLANGRLVFPVWQFTQKGDRALLGLNRVLSALPDDLHPHAVAGFFLTPQPDLVIDGQAVPVAAWLEKGGSAEPVLAIARALGDSY